MVGRGICGGGCPAFNFKLDQPFSSSYVEPVVVICKRKTYFFYVRVFLLCLCRQLRQ